jgi:hypothetical protein
MPFGMPLNVGSRWISLDVTSIDLDLNKVLARLQSFPAFKLYALKCPVF